MAAAAAEAVEVAPEAVAGAAVEAAADAADVGADAAAVAACHGAVAASVRLERLPISARRDMSITMAGLPPATRVSFVTLPT